MSAPAFEPGSTMSDSLDPNVSPAVQKYRTTRRAHRPASGSALPEWAAWAVLGGLIVVGAVGSRVVQAAVRSSKAAKTSESAQVTNMGPAGAAPSPPSRVNGASSATTGAAGPKISALHLVVTYADSIMGKSLHITRTREQAKQRIDEALARARKGEDFAKLVSAYSEEPHTDETHGELKNFTRKDAIPSFADAAFQLKIGEISEPVDTPFGYMLILRTK